LTATHLDGALVLLLLLLLLLLPTLVFAVCLFCTCLCSCSPVPLLLALPPSPLPPLPLPVPVPETALIPCLIAYSPVCRTCFDWAPSHPASRRISHHLDSQARSGCYLVALAARSLLTRALEPRLSTARPLPANLASAASLVVPRRLGGYIAQLGANTAAHCLGLNPSRPRNKGAAGAINDPAEREMLSH
jgi:hypothetical protein